MSSLKTENTYLLIFGTTRSRVSYENGVDRKLVYSHKVTGITLRLRELHGIHTFSSVPMEESGSLVHCSELESPGEISKQLASRSFLLDSNSV